MSNKPNNPAHKPNTPAKEVFDANALFDEMDSEGTWFERGGEEFFLPSPTSWPDAAFEAANSNDPVTSSKLILGEDNYARFVEVGGNALKLQRLIEKLHGASMGESSGSSSS
jgi:hypothetical protein